MFLLPEQIRLLPIVADVIGLSFNQICEEAITFHRIHLWFYAAQLALFFLVPSLFSNLRSFTNGFSINSSEEIVVAGINWRQASTIPCTSSNQDWSLSVGFLAGSLIQWQSPWGCLENLYTPFSSAFTHQNVLLDLHLPKSASFFFFTFAIFVSFAHIKLVAKLWKRERE